MAKLIDWTGGSIFIFIFMILLIMVGEIITNTTIIRKMKKQAVNAALRREIMIGMICSSFLMVFVGCLIGYYFGVWYLT